MKRGLFFLVILFILLIPIKGHSISQPPSNLLSLAWSAENQVSFVGVENTGIYLDGHREFNISRVFAMAPNKFRREYIYPPELAGDILIDDGNQRYYYQAKRRTVIIKPTLFSPEQKQLQERQLQLIYKNYNITQSHSKFLDRDITEVTISDKEDKKPILALWIDNETYTILKRELYSPDGKIRQYSFYAEIKFNPTLNNSLFVWQKPSELLTTIEQKGESILSIQEAQKKYPELSSMPTLLNNEYECLGVREVPNGIVLQFSDGIRSFLVFNIKPLPPLPPIATEKNISGRKVFYWRVDDIEGIVWKYKDKSFLVIGQLGQNIIERLIEDIK
ncbi:MAG: LolA family protein [bacterium]